LALYFGRILTRLGVSDKFSGRKGRPQSGWCCQVQTLFRQGEERFFICERPYDLVQKTSDIACGVSEREKGLGECEYFAGKGNKFFAILCGHRLLLTIFKKCF